MGTSLHQTEYWRDRDGQVHLLNEMSLQYKINVLAYLERNAPRVMAAAITKQIEGRIERLGKSMIIPCVINEIDGVPIECGATHEWAHGVWHGAGPFPGSEIDNMLADELVNEYGIKLDAAKAIVWVRNTPLARRLRADIEAELDSAHA